MRSRGAGAILALVLALVVPGNAAAQSLRFVGPADPREVSLPLASETERRGSITVVIRNVSGVTGVLELRFFPDRGQPVRLVGGDDPGSKLAQAKPSGRVVFRRNQYRGIQVTFVLPNRKRLSRVNGMLVAQLRARGPGKSQQFPKAAQLRVRGTSPPVRFSPAEVALKVRHHCWLLDVGDCGREAQVLIRGEDVAALRTEGTRIGHVVVGNGDGGEASLELTDAKVDGGVLTGTVKVDDTSGVGEFKGALPLAPGIAGGPELPVSVTVGHSLGWAVVFVFLGAFVGGGLALFRGIRRRRKLLGLEVSSMLERYDREKDESGGTPAGYDIDAHIIQPRYNDRRGVRPFPGNHGVSGLLWRIDSAQDDHDFDEAATNTDAFIATVDWWIRLEPWAREITRQIEERTVPRRASGMRFTECDAFADTYALRQKLRSRPKKEEEVQDLQQRAAAHCLRLTRWRALWHLHLEVEKANLELTDQQADALRDAEIETIQDQTKPGKAADEEAEAQRVALEDRLLDEAGDTLRYLLATAKPGVSERVEEDLEADRERIEDLTSTMVARPLVDRGLLYSIRRHGLDETASRLWQDFKSVQRGDLMWTLLSALVASTAYALTIWDDTWGTITDYATAFTAGFLTDAVVKWAVLPAFQSYRVRRRAAATEAKKSTSLLQELEATLKRVLSTQASGSAPSGSDAQRESRSTTV